MNPMGNNNILYNSRIYINKIIVLFSIVESKKESFLKFTDKVLKVYKTEWYTNYELTSLKFPDSTKCNYNDTFIFTSNKEYKRKLHTGNKTEGCNVIEINSHNDKYTEYWSFVEFPVLDIDYPNNLYLHLYGNGSVVNTNAFSEYNLNESYIIDVEDDKYLVLINNNNSTSMDTHYEKKTFYTLK
ncbi:hypothetical protein GCM10007962_32450 [Yeosuana aromativorans]|uniref:Uncharacterized protein n=2 Tax=Yeosuana aromativorans TaxID=288019 RepID=A0A8J3FJ82_9FLAO|nr:hypothetical protein GCM10007962_32450 [Yeosuana aromativorans]